MPVPSIVIDGAHSYGSHRITIDAVEYIADDIRITRAVDKAQDNTNLGSPNRGRYTGGRATGTATLQIPASGTRPQFGKPFTDTFDANYGAETFVLMPVHYEASSDPGEIRKMPIEFEKVYSGSITTVA